MTHHKYTFDGKGINDATDYAPHAALALERTAAGSLPPWTYCREN